MDSLWGSIPEVPVITTPAKILSEQAGKLQEATRGVVVGEVVSVPPKLYQGSGVAYELRITVPVLNNYTARIVHVEHGVLSYPCRAMPLRGAQREPSVKIDGEEEFLAFLKEHLSDPDLMKLISNLIAQVNAVS